MAKKKKPKLTIVTNECDGASAAYIDGRRELCSDGYIDFRTLADEDCGFSDLMAVLDVEYEIKHAHDDWYEWLDPGCTSDGTFYPMDLKDVVIAGTKWSPPRDPEVEAEKIKLAGEVSALQEELNAKLNQLRKIDEETKRKK